MTNNTFLSQGVQDVVEATISDSSKAFVFDILRNKIYSNKIAATVRETVSNAKDSHSAARKVDSPIYIEIPDQDHPFFVVQDWGTGIPPEVMERVYMDYGSSTKKDADSETTPTVGKFGINVTCALN
jgi:DNA topoisomerase VI subunit B